MRPKNLRMYAQKYMEHLFFKHTEGAAPCRIRQQRKHWRLGFVLLLFASALPAYAVPSGCFVEDSSYTRSCSYWNFWASDCDQVNMSSYWFGSYISGMCSYVNTLEADYGSLSAAYAEMVSQRDGWLSTAGAIEAARQQWVAYSTYQTALIKKLKRACGTKCKKIK